MADKTPTRGMKYLSIAGGRRKGAGRPRSHEIERELRLKRLWIPQDLHDQWKRCKKELGCQNDAAFFEYLLNLAQSSLEATTKRSSHIISPAICSVGSINDVPGFDQDFLPLSSTPITDRQCFLDTNNWLDESTLTAGTPSPQFSSELPLNDDEDETIVATARTLLCESDNESDSETDNERDSDDGDSDMDLDVSFSDPALVDLNSATSDCAVQNNQDMTTCYVTTNKVLVNVSNLLELAKTKCHLKECSEDVTSCAHYVNGCSIKLEMHCRAGHFYVWNSCPDITSKSGGVIPANNILIAAGCLFSGSHFAKYFMMNRICHIHSISESVFYRYQKHLLIPVIDEYWLSQQQEILAKLSGESLVVAGDGRCDSPGTCAKYCSYTLMDTETMMVVHTTTVDKREVGGKSPNMEREALYRGLSAAMEELTIQEIVTDASSSVSKMLADTFPSITHSLDVWHKSKKLKKSLNKVGRLKANQKIMAWSGNIINHFWHCCRSCNGEEELLKDLWFGLLHHVQNQHIWDIGRCSHDNLTESPKDDRGNVLEYFDPNEAAMENLKAIVMDENWLKSLRFYVNFRHTGVLESLHNLMLMYCPKRVHFKGDAYSARIKLAVIDHNYHLGRPKRPRASTNHPFQHRRVYRKASKKWDAVPVLKKKSYSYSKDLCVSVVKKYQEFESRLTDKVKKSVSHPETISSTIACEEPPATSVIVQTKQTRFLN